MHIRICQVIVSFTTSSAHKIICRQNYALRKVLNCWYTTLKLIIANGATLCLCYFTFQCLVQYRVHWINQWCTSKTEPIQSHLVYNPSQLSELNRELSISQDLPWAELNMQTDWSNKQNFKQDTDRVGGFGGSMNTTYTYTQPTRLLVNQSTSWTARILSQDNTIFMLQKICNWLLTKTEQLVC